ncbi:ABC transporter ATP-binding protein [Streptomyces sp. NPDC093595]|uniref:ABC transporter ATP-binding protein n=1 Tax=Streptomyces sp. NPDC093595 TaxID=3366045 RepID=UPI0037F4988F
MAPSPHFAEPPLRPPAPGPADRRTQSPAGEEPSVPPEPGPSGSPEAGGARPGTAVRDERTRPWLVLTHLRPHRPGILLGSALSLAGSLLALAQPLVAKQMVDALDRGRPAVGALVLLSALVVAGAATAALGQYVLERTAESVACTARRRLSERLLRLRLPELNRTEPGELISRVTSDTTVLRQVATRSIASAGSGLLVVVATLALMALLDPVLLSITLVTIALIGTTVAAAVPHIARAAREAQEAVGRMGSLLERTLGALRTIKASGAEGRETAGLHRAAEDARRAGTRAAKWQALSATTSTVAVQLSFLVVLGVGGARVATGAITVSTLVAFLLYVFALAPRVGQLVEAIGLLQAGSAAAARIGEVHSMETETETERGTEPAGPPQGPATAPEPHRPVGVVFEGVRFSYGPEAPPVHEDVTFTVPPRTTTALVGPSGAGKTTVFSLLERFCQPDRGRILLDGEDIARLPLSRLRALIGYVEQDSPILSGTLRDNLLLSAPDADAAQLRDVLGRTRLDSLVARLPDGLDTPIGHRGSTLSGGERQRVAIARALLRRPGLLLLDEATSQLDAANEAALHETLAEVSRTTTILVIAHRLSTVTTADQILLLESGRIRAAGTHAQLLATDALYRRLAAAQHLA